MSCARKVTAAVLALDGVTHAEANKSSLMVDGSPALSDIFKAVEDLGYQAGQTIFVDLTGLRCGKCVAKLRTALSTDSRVVAADISKTSATVTGILSRAEVIDIVRRCGYDVTDQRQQTDESQPSPLPDDPSRENRGDSTTIPGSPDSHVSGPVQTQLLLSGMTCASCVSAVENAIRSVSGVEGVNVNLAERTAMISGDDIEIDSVINAVIDAGFGADLVEDEATRRQRQNAQQQLEYRTHLKHAGVALAVGIPLMLWGLLGGNMSVNSFQSQLGWGLVSLICLTLLATTGRTFFVGAGRSLKHRRANMDTLIALGTSAAWLYSTVLVLIPEYFPVSARHVYFEATAMILGLITLGHAIEARARASASAALDKLLDLQPETAVVITDEGDKEVPLREVQTGMTLRIRPGGRIPVDGHVTEGDSYVDESMLTGEPLAVHKQTGNRLSAGTLNQRGSLAMQAEGVGKNTMLARIIHLVREAQSSKPALAKMADRISAVFVPVVVTIALATAAVWYFFGPEPRISFMLITATTVLIIACPCALGLATPMSVITGVGRAADYGVLIKDADAIQQAANIDVVIFDKTGTLTEGKPSVTSLHSEIKDENQLIRLAASIEQGSEHPLAVAIINEAEKRDIKLLTSNAFRAIPGMGVQAEIDGEIFYLGNLAMMTRAKVDTSKWANKQSESGSNSETLVYLANQRKLLGVVGISDPVRSDSAAAVKKLKSMGLSVVLLTGDRQQTAQHIAEKLGIDTVISGVLPDAKEAEVQRLQSQGLKVAMVGDGINDAPSLARADLGIAMGSGSDIAVESGSVTLMRHSIDSVADTLSIAKATIRNMKQNLWGAFIYNSLGIPVAAGILYPLTGTLLSPVVAGAAMALSSITVVSNANRLRRFTPDNSKVVS
ncbi:copper-translocating P-type ATPase [Veronia pacifica]|uniref:Copper-exporting P-type ATPase n=2 Tax=Veronia pacifica TaxID=1080227 RepID=A0A1C3EDX1_9GAMM|nr:copper-translocating P-type ATPase [Veronia pacifica]